MAFANTLAEHILSVSPSAVSGDVRYWTIVSMLDTMGVAIAGASEPGVRLLDQVTNEGRGAGPCILLGTARTSSAQDAALVNGMAAHALDFDASNPYFAGHATMHLLAGSYAVSELVNARCRDLFIAYLAGFEAQSRVARALQPAHSELGWFPSSTLGVIGVAAAAGRLFKLPPKEMATAIAIATNFSSGLLAHAGSMSKPLAAGHSARNGVLAAQLAAKGFTAQTGVFEHKHGFLKAFDEAGRFDSSTVLNDWGRPFDIVVTATGIKQHPCCGTAHAGIDVLARIIAENNLRPNDIEQVEVAIITDMLAHIDRPNPTTPLDAKFSGHYCMARTILGGRPRVDDFEGTAFLDPAAREIMKRVSLHVHPAMYEGMPRYQQGGTDVDVLTKDGRRFKGSLDQPLGREPGKPLADEHLHGKFVACVERAFPTDVAHRLLAQMLEMDGDAPVLSISSTMMEGAGRSTVS